MGKLSITGPALDSSVLTHRIPRQACEESGSVWAALKAEVWCRLARRKQEGGRGESRAGEEGHRGHLGAAHLDDRKCPCPLAEDCPEGR